MSNTHTQTCAECGARLAEEAEVCDLCGLPVTEGDAVADVQETFTEPTSDEAGSPVVPVQPPAERSAVPSGVHCNQCGWRNPVGAHFCSMCGSRLQDLTTTSLPGTLVVSPAVVTPTMPPTVPPAGSSSEEATTTSAAKQSTQKEMSRQVGIIVGAGVLLVLVLFLVTAVSKNQSLAPAVQNAQQATSATTLDAGALPPLQGPLAEQVAALETEIEQLEGEAKAVRQRELVSVLFGAGRLDRAAVEQQQVAEAQDTSEDWKRAGDLFYDWMVTLEDQRKVQAAQQAIAAYQRVLDKDPDNLDVRTDMATAYLSSNNPMQGVQEIKRVLDTDPNHLHALFNYGIMLSMIGRSEQAIEQFERVKELEPDPASRYYQQADEAIQALQQGGRL